MGRYQHSRKRRTGSGSTKIAGQATFAGLVLDRVPGGRRAVQTPAGEELVELDYRSEIEIKNAALASFWRQFRLPGSAEPLLCSPLARGYRSSSKRRVGLIGTTAHLFLGDRKARRDMPVFRASPLEPAEHADLYRFLQEQLSEPGFRIVAKHLNWLIVRGSYAERAVIFNVDALFGPLVRKLKILGGRLATHSPAVAAAYVYLDESGSDYYLETRRPERTLDFKKLFGPDCLRVCYGDLELGFHPTSFCQVNESIVPEMLRLATQMLEPRSDELLLDLYCGFGLFSHALGTDVREVVGIDAATASIDAARENARRMRRRTARFIAARVSAGTLRRLPAATTTTTTGSGKGRTAGGSSNKTARDFRGGSDQASNEIVLLDPPRDGAEAGVIEAVAARRPRRIVHVFCSVDQIPAALAKWQAQGYAIQRIAPLDMFPGTPHLEVLIQLAPRGNRQPS